MKGGIYSDERCPVCGGVFVDNKRALICEEHKTKPSRYKVKFGTLCKRFRSYEDADRFLTGVRFETDQGKYDERDYRKDNPLSFDNLSEKYLDMKKGTLRPRSYQAIVNHMRHAQRFLGHRNVKDINYGDLEDFFRTLSVKEKTKHNIRSTLHGFLVWVSKREGKMIMPEFPSISFELGYRNTVSKEIQLRILEEVKRISYDVNQKIYIGIKWLCTYISIRPGELVSIKEENLDLENGYLYFPHPKEKKYKSVPLIKEDVKILEEFPKSFPKMPFFRHVKGVSGVKENEPFGLRYFYKWWKKACTNLGIEDVDLYGGTRHSSARALRAYRTPEEIKRATMHSTNKAFERYFNMESDDLRNIYEDTGKVIKFNHELKLKKNTEK
jgi:integrase